jgi:hypothetical protein
MDDITETPNPGPPTVMNRARSAENSRVEVTQDAAMQLRQEQDSMNGQIATLSRQIATLMDPDVRWSRWWYNTGFEAKNGNPCILKPGVDAVYASA